MPIFAQTLIIEGSGHGYSETYYFRRDTTSLTAAALHVKDHVLKRKLLIGKEGYIKGERIARKYLDDMTPVKRRTIPLKYFHAGVQAQPCEDSGTSLQVLWTSADGDKKKIQFLSLPYRSIFPEGDSYDGGRDGTGNWQTNFNAWVDFCKSKHLGWISEEPSAPIEIQTYTFNAANGRVTYTLKEDLFPGPFNGKPVKVRVEFPTIRSALDGVQLVIPTDARTAITAKPRPSMPFTIPGNMVLFTKVFVDVGAAGVDAQAGTIVPENPVGRKRGRPLLVSRGRAPVRVKW